MVFREGQNINTFTCEAGYHLALLVQASTEAPLGWARMVIRKAAGELAHIAATPTKEEVKNTAAEPNEALQQEDLPNLFSDALDDLWLE